MQVEVNIWSLVNSLLYNHNCVIVPNLGGFLAHQQSATIDPVSMVINPPTKTITFNAQLKLNDGLLATKVADYLKINYVDAIKIIETEVANFDHLLNYNGQIVLSGLGVFTHNVDRNLVFTPEKNTNFLLHSFGLQPIRLNTGSDAKTSKIITNYTETIVPTTEEEVVVNDNVAVLPKTKSKRSGRGLTFTAIGSVLVLVLALNAYIFLQEGSLTPIRNKYNELNLGVTIKTWFDNNFKSATETITPTPTVIEKAVPVTPPAQDIIIDSNAINNTPDNTNMDSVIAKPITVTEESKPINEIVTEVLTATIAEKSSYYIIAGAFETEKRANKLLQELTKEGYPEAELIANPKTKSRDIKFFVTYKKLNDFNASTIALNTIHESENPDAWILLAR
ncbi:MAG: SPOR domain-containing protein [Bacteroidota bacterium]